MSNFIYPLQRRVGITSSFQDHLNRTPPAVSPGIDLADNKIFNEPIYAIEDVKIKNYLDKYGSKCIDATSIDGKRIWRSLHLNDFVETGIVKQGEKIGHVGNTGYVLTYDAKLKKWRTLTDAERKAGRGAHYSLSLKENGEWVDPMKYLNDAPLPNETNPSSKPSSFDYKLYKDNKNIVLEITNGNIKAWASVSRPGKTFKVSFSKGHGVGYKGVVVTNANKTVYTVNLGGVIKSYDNTGNTNSLDYRLYKNGKNIMFELTSGIFQGWAIVKRPGKTFKVSLSKKRYGAGYSGIMVTNANKAVYEVNIGGVIKSFDNK